jgi:hypothetical protein
MWLTGTAAADVRIEQKMDVDAPGALSLMAMEGTVTTAISGGKARTDNDLAFKSGMMRAFGGDAGKTSEIIRLDEDRVISIDHSSESYTETTFEAMRAQMEQAMSEAEDAMAARNEPGAPSTTMPVAEESCEWGETGINVEATGKKERIAGQSAENTIVTATRTCRDPETGNACDIVWKMDTWLSESVPGSGEANQFWQAYAEKMGFEEMVGRVSSGSMMTLFSQYEDGWSEIQKYADELTGYPLRTIMAVQIGGDDCTMPDGQAISYEAMYGDAVSEAMSQSAAESIGEAAGGAFGGEIAKGLLGAFGKKKKKEPEPEKQAPSANPGYVTLFEVRTETTAIDTGDIAAREFEIPEGYRQR